MNVTKHLIGSSSVPRAAHAQTARSPSSPTIGRTRSSAPARSRSRPRMIPTTSPSASATSCRTDQHHGRDGADQLLPAPYAGLDRYAARKKISKTSKEQDLLVGIKDHTHAIWQVRPLQDGGRAAPLHAVVRRRSSRWPDEGHRSRRTKQGSIRFTPEKYQKIYLEWMNNIHDWCISRQLWWGHRIPAWHCAACHKTRSPAKRRQTARTAARATSRRTLTCSTPGSPPACCPSRSSAGPSRREAPQLRPISRPSIPPRCSSPASTSCSSGWRA